MKCVRCTYVRNSARSLRTKPLSWALGMLLLAAATTQAAGGTGSVVRFQPPDPAGEPPIQELGAGPLVDPNRPQSIYDGGEGRVPQIVEGQFRLPELTAPTTETAEIGDGTTPEGFRGQQEAPRRPLPETRVDTGLLADWKVRSWAAPNTFANPRYFEDRMLERHGHERLGHLQPLASGARFFATVPMLPYLSTVRAPWECEYTLGYYRVGSCAPVMLQRPPYERQAAVVEAASIAGAILIFP